MADGVTVPKSHRDGATCRAVRMHLLPPQGQDQILIPHTLTHLVSLKPMTLRHSRQETRTEARTQIRKMQQVTTCLVAFCTCVIALHVSLLPRRNTDEGVAGIASACSQSGFFDSAAPVLFTPSFWVCFPFWKPLSLRPLVTCSCPALKVPKCKSLDQIPSSATMYLVRALFSMTRRPP